MAKPSWRNFWNNRPATRRDVDEILDAIRRKDEDANTLAQLAADLRKSSDALKTAVSNNKPESES